ncbi:MULTISPECIES: P-loop NTPase fold protein [unclassified Pseudomonas]|uniref:P-loop NTPase fold protein n=1 Tax=unclassified Pseudomonas TaxID=196821 RepID=UPI001CC1AEAB|nr:MULTISPECIES: P-loop NTPase fold protein [unclassified Pseudomonas]
MSVQQVRSALEMFVSEPNSRAVVLKGEWGTGKTYLWNMLLKQKKESISRKKYAYVSLFGLSNLADLKRAIFENVVSSENADVNGDFKSLIGNLAGVGHALERAVRKGVKVTAETASLPFVKGLGGVVDAISFASVADTLICIDDYERRNTGLSGKEVLGLISYLVENKNCSVILVLNHAQLEGGLDEYFQFNEKVFDYEIEFSPTPHEAANLVFDMGDEYESRLLTNSIALKISNIRILKKILYFSKALRGVVLNYPEPIVTQVLHTLPLVVWSIYSSDPQRVMIGAIKEFGGGGFEDFFASKDGSADATIKNKTSIFLKEYGFSSCDELDVAVIFLVEKGYLDEGEIRKLAEKMAEKVKHNKEIQMLREAWSVYRCSFRDNEDELLGCFEKALKVCLGEMSFMDLDSICETFRGLGRDERAAQIVDEYMLGLTRRGAKIDKRQLFRWPKDKYLSDALNAYIEDSKVEKEFADYILPYVGTNGLDSEDYLRLSQADVDDFYDFFSRADSENLHAWVLYCLEFGSIRASEDESQKAFRSIFLKSYEAILKIRGESLLNKMRTDTYMSYQEMYDELKEKESL